ncbi:DNA/RNA nuclease SfsA [Kangiella sp. HZ709]|uniref:DNA/RNA nuclease SfsA n=1 Tax=Kangiella sp. HZ709 TaxID=2666328 RepID=UPI0012B0FB3D|nr:DNA/RNA nuclease SfsA [Kangiella sp. HZ709]MRX27687.1 DNA/RNA nuclease SfsA [Kangiella sp. HZ709]
MKFSPPLLQATLIKRYKRFLADVVHDQLGGFTVHCPNTGSMKNCWAEGDTVYLLDSQNPNRKYQYTWISSQTRNGYWLCLNTHLANQIVIEGIENQMVSELQGYSAIKPEVKYGEENSRIDLLLTSENKADCYVEIKTVTLLEEQISDETLETGRGFFPDAVSTRGQKHLRELMTIADSGSRAVLFFLVQHSGIKSVSAAAHIDPKYAQLLSEAINAGVEILCYRTHISPAEIRLQESLPFIYK